MLTRRANWIFISCTVLSSIIFGQMFLFTLGNLFNLRIGLNLIQYCEFRLLPLGLPIDAALLNGLVLYTVGVILWKSVMQLLLTHQMRKRFLTVQHHELTQILNRRYSTHCGRVLVARCQVPFAVTMGLIRSRVVISTGLVSLLDEEELEAVMYHEQHHSHHRDTLKGFLLQLCASVCWYVPLLDHLEQQHRVLREILADNFAASQMGNSRGIGSALLKLIKHGVPNRFSASHASFADTAINDRVKQLVKPDSPFHLRIPSSLVLASASSILCLCAMFAVFLL